jgi:hypothetical protein
MTSSKLSLLLKHLCANSSRLDWLTSFTSWQYFDPVSQRIWTPRGCGSPSPYQLADSDPYGTGRKFVVADQNIAGRNKAPLHLHSKQSRKLARSCFSWRFFAFHSTIHKLTVILLQIDHELFVLGWGFF